MQMKVEKLSLCMFMMLVGMLLLCMQEENRRNLQENTRMLSACVSCGIVYEQKDKQDAGCKMLCMQML